MRLILIAVFAFFLLQVGEPVSAQEQPILVVRCENSAIQATEAEEEFRVTCVTYTPTPTPTLTPTATETPTETPTATSTHTTTPTATATRTATPQPPTATPVPTVTRSPLAFPGAEGYGRFSQGGYGGQILFVTNTNDSGPGSLRAAINATGKRTVLFRVSGTITVNTPLSIDNPYITIAGQTAPAGDTAGGITIRAGNTRSLFLVNTHNVVIRYIRLRPGVGCTPGCGNGDQMDGLNSQDDDAYLVMLDHLSVSWSVDEAVEFYNGGRESTLQNTLIGEPLNFSTHSYTLANPLIGHSKCLMDGADSPHKSGNISMLHNVLTDCWDRFPESKPSYGVVDIIGNVFSNWGARFGSDSKQWVTLTNDLNGPPVLNIVNNYYQPGPNSTGVRNRIQYLSHHGRQLTIYLSGNYDSLLGALTTVTSNGPVLYRTSPSGEAAYTVQPVLSVYSNVLATSGASRRLGCDGSWINNRDSVDNRIIANVLSGTGRIINSPSDVGGWPVLSTGTPCTDSDDDGMPDLWEINHGTQAGLNDAWIDKDGDGWANLENYLSGR